MIWRLRLIETTSPGCFFPIGKKNQTTEKKKIYKIHYDDISSVFAQLEVED